MVAGKTFFSLSEPVNMVKVTKRWITKYTIHHHTSCVRQNLYRKLEKTIGSHCWCVYTACKQATVLRERKAMLLVCALVVTHWVLSQTHTAWISWSWLKTEYYAMNSWSFLSHEPHCHTPCALLSTNILDMYLKYFIYLS